MIRVAIAEPSDLETVRTLMREYAEALGVDLEYQGFEEELRDLPGEYAGPSGTLLLAWNGPQAVGCVGVRPLESDAAEMKRLYVRPAGRGTGVGRRLAEAAIAFARDAGYQRMRLDTLPQMASAQRLYETLGFQPIEAYRYSPVPGTRFMELSLEGKGAQFRSAPACGT